MTQQLTGRTRHRTVTVRDGTFSRQHKLVLQVEYRNGDMVQAPYGHYWRDARSEDLAELNIDSTLKKGTS